MKFEELPAVVQTDILGAECTCPDIAFRWESRRSPEDAEPAEDKTGAGEAVCRFCRAIRIARALGYGGGWSFRQPYPTPHPADFPPLMPEPNPSPFRFGRPRFDPRTCHCNPENGGSGVCGCVLGGYEVWC